MAVHGGPKVAAPDGLVLSLDVGNKKTFANSIINSTSWSLGSGSVTGYAQNGATAENERVTGTDPFGKSAVVWETRPEGNTADDGGWNSSWYNIDSTKLHRFSVWVKRTTSTYGGTFYLGLYGNNGIRRTDNNAVEGNPYWDCRGTSGFEKDIWYLVVGHCYPYNTSYTGQHPDSGIYTVVGGTTKVASINACNIGADVKWAGSDVTQAIHRCYHYYCSDNTTRLQLFDPRIDVIDGTELSIGNLLSGFTANRLSSLTNNITTTFANGPTYSSANGGSIAFDGTDDYVNCGTPPISAGKITVNAWVKINAGSLYQHIVDSASNAWHLAILADNRPYFWNGSTYHTAAPILTVGQWYMITGVQGTTLDIYINGVLGQSIASNINVTTNNVILGAWQSGSRPLNGNISNTQIYNRALSADEISQNFNATRGRYGV
jgi:hypothetical protein